MNYSGDQVASLLKRYSRFFPKPDIVFLLDIPEEIAYERKDDVPSIEYLSDRRSIYLDVAERSGMRVLDGRKSVTELVEETKRILLNEFN